MHLPEVGLAEAEEAVPGQASAAPEAASSDKKATVALQKIQVKDCSASRQGMLISRLYMS
jgi:hypothetical protein